MKQPLFDPCRTLRALVEALYREGLTEDALRMARRIDEAQLAAWQEQPQKSLQSC